MRRLFFFFIGWVGLHGNCSASTGAVTVTPNITSYEETTHVTVGDFNGDGLMDTAVAHSISSNETAKRGRLHVYLQNTAGELILSGDYDGGTGGSAAAGDLNSDGRTDLVVPTASGIGVLLQNTTGTLDPMVVTPGEHSSRSVLTGDFNHDGKTDVIAAGASVDFIDLYLQSDAGILAAPTLLTARRFGETLFVADVNGDGRDDIASTYRAATSTPSGRSLKWDVLIQEPAGGFSSTTTDSGIFSSGIFGDALGAPAVGDVTGDGRADLVVTGLSADGRRVLSVLVQRPDRTFVQAAVQIVPEGPIAILDVTDDGRADVLLAAGRTLHVLPQLRNGTLGPVAVHANGSGSGRYGTVSLALGDVNNDGVTDVVGAFPRTEPSVFVWPGSAIRGPFEVKGTTGRAFTYQIQSRNGATVYEADNLPEGLQIDPGTGLISGQPIARGISTVPIRMINGTKVGRAELTLIVNDPLVMAEAAGSYYATVTALVPPYVSGGGNLRLALTANRWFSGVLALDARRIPFVGRFDPSGRALVVAGSGFRRMTLRVAIERDQATFKITGSVRVGAIPASVSGRRSWDENAGICPQAGSYTFAINDAAISDFASPRAEVPPLVGVGVFGVDQWGRVRMVVALADGQRMTIPGWVDEAGGFPLTGFATDRRESLDGFMRITDGVSADARGDLYWRKPARRARFYPQAIATNVVLKASKYLPASPVLDVPAASAESGVFYLAADLPEPAFQAGHLDPLNQPQFVSGPLATTLRLDARTGWISGSFRHPATGALTPLLGVALPRFDAGIGFFAGLRQTGVFSFADHTAPADEP